MAAIGTTSLLFAFGGLAGAAGGYAFDAIRALPAGPLVSVLILAGAIVGAGSKAGIAPLHAWLPLAHPAAPSHVSALMSGVMTKVAIYGLHPHRLRPAGTAGLVVGVAVPAPGRGDSGAGASSTPCSTAI